MALGKSIVRADRNDRAIVIEVKVDNKGKIGENAGMLATVTNEVHDILRRHFCAHQISVPKYEEPKLPVRFQKKAAKK